ncbi:MAG TPA: hypothetical protein PK963_04500 [Arachnia sp.]|jgi:hypothetical protein|nr:hypothetical protein [Arachnia sp.]
MSTPSPEAPGTWTAVPAGEADAQPPAPAWSRFLGPAVAAALVISGGLIGAGLGGLGGESEPEPEPSPTLSMDPPVQVGEFVRGEVTESTGPAPENQRIVRADYSDGADKLIFVMTWPEEDLSAYVTDAGVQSANEAEPGTLCGTSIDTTFTACGRIKEETALLLLAVTEQTEPAVLHLLGEFDAAVTP